MSTKINFATKRKTVDVYVEELEATLTLQALSVKDLGANTDSAQKDNTKAAIDLLARSIIDRETRERLYTVEELEELSITAVKQLSDEAMTLNGFGKNVIEEQTKKYLATLESDSSSV